MPNTESIRFQFTIRDAAIGAVGLCATLALSLWLTRRNGFETAVNLVQVAAILAALKIDARATWPGVVIGGLLSGFDSSWSALGTYLFGNSVRLSRPDQYPDYLWMASVSFYWGTFGAWFGAGASALVRGRRTLGIVLAATAIAWLAATFVCVLFLSKVM